MIRIKSESGRTLRLINENNSGLIFYTKDHGFVSEESLKKRQKMRAHEGHISIARPPLFLVKANQDLNAKNLLVEGNCQLEALDEIQWKLRSPAGNFVIDWIEDQANLQETPLLLSTHKKNQKIDSSLVIPLLLGMIALLFMFWRFQLGSDVHKTAQQTALLQAPVVVVPVVKEVVKAKIEMPKPVEEHHAIDKKVVAQKALTQNLGFLKLTGRPDLKKAVGGLPTQAPEVSAGAGAGGSEGSGGQMLNGIGQGLRKTTVGNSGVAGLGGIGTKGAGGGLGGYGQTDYGSGAGKSVSATALSQDAVIEGGLDRSAIAATIQRYLSQVRACYEEGLKRKADLIGQVSMNFEINGAGNVNYSNVQRSSLGDREVESCISTRMLTWKFPVPRGNVNVKVSYPFMLRPIKS